MCGFAGTCMRIERLRVDEAHRGHDFLAGLEYPSRFIDVGMERGVVNRSSIESEETRRAG